MASIQLPTMDQIYFFYEPLLRFIHIRQAIVYSSVVWYDLFVYFWNIIRRMIYELNKYILGDFCYCVSIWLHEPDYSFLRKYLSVTIFFIHDIVLNASFICRVFNRFLIPIPFYVENTPLVVLYFSNPTIIWRIERIVGPLQRSATHTLSTLFQIIIMIFKLGIGMVSSRKHTRKKALKFSFVGHAHWIFKAWDELGRTNCNYCVDKIL